MKFLKQLREQDFRGSGKYNSTPSRDFRGTGKTRGNTIAHYDAEQYPENQRWSRHDDPRARAMDMINQAVEDNEDSFEIIGDPDSLIKYLKGRHHDFSPELEQMIRDIIDEELGYNEEYYGDDEMAGGDFAGDPRFKREEQEERSMRGYQDQDLWAGASLNAPLKRKTKRAKRIYDKQLRKNVRRHQYEEQEESGAPWVSDLEDELNEMHKRFAAARRGIGITNQMKPGPERTKHRKRIMGNLNRIRGQLNRVMKYLASADDAVDQMKKFDSAEKDYEAGKGYQKGPESRSTWLS